jgi:hypothetical protein
LLLLLALVVRFFGPLKRASTPTERAGRTKAGADPAQRDVFLPSHLWLAVLVWVGVSSILTFLFLSL